MKKDFVSRLECQVAKGEGEITGLELAKFLERRIPEDQAYLLPFAYLVASAVEDGHTCLMLSQGYLETYMKEKAVEWFSEIEFWPEYPVEALRKCDLVGEPGEEKAFVLDEQRFYVQRYWAYEQVISHFVAKKARKDFALEPSQTTLADQLFAKGQSGSNGNLKMKEAVLSCVKRGFSAVSIISVKKRAQFIATVLAIFLKGQDEIDKPSIAVCCPDENGAKKLSDLLTAIYSSLGLSEDLRQKLPENAMTMPGVFGAESGSGFYCCIQNAELSWDFVIVERAELLDLQQCASLFRCLSQKTRVLLIGDKNRLPEAEAGGVFQEICAIDDFDVPLLVFDSLNYDYPAISEPAVDKSDNFDNEDEGVGIDPIKILCKLAGKGDYEGVKRVLNDSRWPQVRFINLGQKGPYELLLEGLYDFIMDLKSAASPEEALVISNRFKVICPSRYGHFGCRNINRFLTYKFFHRLPAAPHHLMPILIRRNDYLKGLFIGDKGIMWEMDAETGLAAYFQGANGASNRFSPIKLPYFEPAWAITPVDVKATLFDEVFLILPKEDSFMSGKQLFYSAVNSVKKKLTVWGSEESLRHCIENDITRMSGLRSILKNAA